MRLWSLHPKYLDSKGLVALWREGLLAQHVLQGKTKGYTRHPQLIRFRSVKNSVGAIAQYLRLVADEAEKRNYRFNRSKIVKKAFRGSITVTTGQLEYEFAHLLRKLEKRDPERFCNYRNIKHFDHHDLFRPVPGEREEWEKIS